MTSEVTTDQLGLMLQVSREAALRMLGEMGGFAPFGIRAAQDGAIDLVSNTDELGDEQLPEIADRIRIALAAEAKQGGIIAAAIICNVQLDDAAAGDDFERAVQVHVEAAGFSRVVLIPYRFPEMAAVKLQRDVETGEMIPFDVPPGIFVG